MRSCVWTRNKPDRGDLDSLRPSRPTPVRGLKEGTSGPPTSSLSNPRPGALWRRRGRVRAQVVPRRPGRWVGAGRQWWHDGRPRLGSASADLGCRYRLGARRPSHSAPPGFESLGPLVVVLADVGGTDDHKVDVAVTTGFSPGEGAEDDHTHWGMGEGAGQATDLIEDGGTSRRSTAPSSTKPGSTRDACAMLTPASLAMVLRLSSAVVSANTASMRPWAPGTMASIGRTKSTSASQSR